MPLTDDFDGTIPSPMSLTVVTAGGLGASVPIQGIENLTFPVRNFKKDTWTPISGARARKEQLVLCTEQAAEIGATLTYEREHQLEMDAICGVNGCQVTLVGPDGLTISGMGGVEKLGVARVEDSKHMSADFTFALAAGWTCTAGAVKTIVPAYTFPMVAGGPTSIDLTACGAAGAINLTGKVVTKLVLTATGTNGDPITVAKGAANGYEPVADFSIVLMAGESESLEPLNAPTVGPGAKTLDVSGTGTQSVSVYIEAEDA